jgi:hypothetical protein
VAHLLEWNREEYTGSGSITGVEGFGALFRGLVIGLVVCLEWKGK